MDELSKFKSSFQVRPGYVSLNNAGTSLLSHPAQAAIVHWAQQFCELGSRASRESAAMVEQTRASLARLVGAEATQLAFFSSTSCALSQVAFGLDFAEGDEILTWDQEYPGNFYPWRDLASRTGAKLVIAKSTPKLETPVEALIKAVSPQTKIIAVSWVQYTSGAVTDLKVLSEFAKARGILTCIDVVQGVGLFPFHFSELGLDFACGGSHKWLCSPRSVGYLCLSQEMIARVKPMMVGALTYGTPEDGNSFVVKPPNTGRKFEPGTPNTLALAGFGASIDLILETGVGRVTQEIEWLSRKLSHGLRELGYKINTPHGREHCGSIVNFHPGADAPLATREKIMSSLKDAGIDFAPRGTGVRFSPHAYNTEKDVTRVLEALS